MRVLITGPPASGKSTLARSLAAEHDAEVIDFDVIARELGSDRNHDHPDAIKQRTRQEIERRLSHLAGSAVVIRTAPNAEDRRDWARRIEADRVVVLAVPADEAKRRAAADNRPAWTADAIDNWWRRYQPDDTDEVLAMGSSHTKEAAMADNQQNPDEPAKGDPDPAKPLGDAGKKALDDERKARRDAERQLKEMADQLRALQDKDKSDSERLTEKVTQLEKDLASETARADRYEVALEKGLDMTRAKRLTGSSREELEADADELQTWQAGKPADPVPGKPTTDLKGGGDPTEDPAVNVREVVDSIPRGF